MPLPWVWYRPSWGVPVETQAVMSMAVSMAAAVANGLKRKCVIPLHAPASRRRQQARPHKFGISASPTRRPRKRALALARHRIQTDGSEPPHSVSLIWGAKADRAAQCWCRSRRRRAGARCGPQPCLGNAICRGGWLLDLSNSLHYTQIISHCAGDFRLAFGVQQCRPEDNSAEVQRESFHWGIISTGTSLKAGDATLVKLYSKIGFDLIFGRRCPRDVSSEDQRCRPSRAG